MAVPINRRLWDMLFSENNQLCGINAAITPPHRWLFSYSRVLWNNFNEKVMTYIPPSCDGVGVEVLGNAGELVLSAGVVTRHDANN